MKLKVLDLFSGIGGFSLGLERTGGFETVAFCEIDPFCRRVLAKHWPEVRQYEDVRTLTADTLARDGIAVDVICGGFPCQDISTAGRGAGIEGERSGLWKEYTRIIGEIRPLFVIVENVAALLGRGLDVVLGDMAALGLDAEWHCIPASAVGAPHRRDRIWIIAHPHGYVHAGELDSGTNFCTPGGGEGSNACERKALHGEWVWFESSSGREELAHPQRFGQSRQRQPLVASGQAALIDRQTIDAFSSRVGNIWRAEPDVGRVANGVPARTHRLRGLGNAVVPQIPEMIGHAILASMKESAA
jgi:DNA (cytosine-5)-methyltransferase 1